MKVSCLAAAILCGFVGAGFSATDAKSLKAEIWDVRGPVTISAGQDVPRKAEAGAVLRPGAVIKTGTGAAVDVSLGRNVGFLRVPQNTVVTFEQLNAPTNKTEGLDVQLTISEGALLGDLKDLPETARFEIKIPGGISGVRQGRFRIQAEGFVTLVNGAVLHVSVPQSGEPVLHRLSAPPAVYFSPTEGVKPAPPVLVDEVQMQLRASLRNP